MFLVNSHCKNKPLSQHVIFLISGLNACFIRLYAGKPQGFMRLSYTSMSVIVRSRMKVGFSTVLSGNLKP